jgi:hypothetical protein
MSFPGLEGLPRNSLFIPFNSIAAEGPGSEGVNYDRLMSESGTGRFC